MLSYTLLFLLTGVTLAALPPLDPADLKADASHILVVEVQQIYTSTRTRQPGFTDTLHLHEVKVNAVEKGEGVKVGGVVYARGWTAATRPEMWVGPGGIRGLPAVGEVVRLYLRQSSDGTLSILDPNGVERLGPSASP